ncbi:DMT family transporter [Anaerospora hongkongensis]|uniref:DMT family transporter n=1 Tax=Anaerospora hongkongensis TaxID=244830 RepID=UPI00289E566F|nr:DMT family transporter [Anaerospora hongkongensis]
MTINIMGPLYLSAAAAIWGGMYVASKYALDVVPPFTLLFLRYFFSALTLILLCRHSKVEIIPREDRGILFQIGFFGYFLSVAAQFIGTKLSTAHMGAVITTLSPVFQSGFAILLLGERIIVRQVIAIGLSLAGVLVITGLPGEDAGEAFFYGNLFFLLAACLWGYYSVLSKKIATRHPALRITTWGIMLATGFALLPAVSEITTWDAAALKSLPVILSIGYLAVVSTTVAYYCWNKGLSLMNPHQAGLFFFLQSIVGSILGWLVLDENLSFPFFAGSFLIIAGVYFVLKLR